MPAMIMIIICPDKWGLYGWSHRHVFAEDIMKEWPDVASTSWINVALTKQTNGTAKVGSLDVAEIVI